MEKKTCFVVMGFGTKTDYTKPKTFNLDLTYQYIIKPAATTAGFECIRADEIVHSGNINVPMYDMLLKADVVVADVSTYNCNAFYELGVRHALRPHTTIILAEDGLMFPFDVAQIAVRKYHHLGEGIDFGEVLRMQTALAQAMKEIVSAERADSPVYTFIPDLNPPERARAQSASAAPLAAAAPAPLPAAPAPTANPSIAILMQQAEEAMKAGNFIVAKALFTEVRQRAPLDMQVHVTHRLALTTYKARIPSEAQALDDARALLDSLQPEDSTDTETLGLLQAVHKRIWNMGHDRAHLDRAIWASEKGFYLKNDYYNGINLAFLYNVRATVTEQPADAIADFILAQRTRHRVVSICDAQLASSGGSLDGDAKFWILATLAQAWLGSGDEAKGQLYLDQACALTPPPAQWMIDSTREQLETLRQLLATSPLDRLNR